MSGEADGLLKQFEAEMRAISAQQHQLERRRSILRDAATRLRTGQSPQIVERIVLEETARMRGAA